MTPKEKLDQFIKENPDMIEAQRKLTEKLDQLTTSEAKLQFLQEEMLDNCKLLEEALIALKFQLRPLLAPHLSVIEGGKSDISKKH